MMHDFAYLRPKDLLEASTLLKKGGDEAMILAGGTDLLDLMKGEIAVPEQVVNLKSVDGLKKIDVQPGKGLNIGALVTIRELAEHPEVRQRYSALAQAAARTASPQLRNIGTLGGNLCQRPRCWYFRGDFPCLRKGGKQCFAVMGENSNHCIIGGDPCYIVHPSDPAVALVAMNASVTIRNGKKTRTLPLREFYVLPSQDVTRETILEPGDVVTEIHVPEPEPRTVSAYLKFSERQSWDFAQVSVAVVLVRENGRQIRSGRVALGGVAPVPWLEEEVSEGMTALEISENAVAGLAATALTRAIPLEQNEYKVTLARNLIQQLILETAS